jgi:excisionase family DNA binding protein
MNIPLVYTVAEACAAARAGRTAIYQAIAKGELTARKRGRKTVILGEDLRRWVRDLPTIKAKPELDVGRDGTAGTRICQPSVTADSARATRRNQQAPLPASSGHAVIVCDGRRRVGTVLERNGELLAFDIRDRRIGVFTNLADAISALTGGRSA